MILADSRYTIQARREAPDARLFEAYGNLPERWPEIVASVGARRVGVEAGFVSHAAWQRLAAAAPDVELVPVEGWIEAGSRGQGARRAGTGRRRVCRRRPGPRVAPARDPRGVTEAEQRPRSGWSG